ncbi:MAG: putative Flagellin, Flp1-like, domain [Clostridiales bacterium]|nr:putative Flagellin, Flp1-like, domain [Clostridiales bacterium]
MKTHIQNMDIKRRLYQRRLTESFMRIRSDERGMGTIEIVLILAVLVGLALLFKDYAVGLFDKIKAKIDTDATSIIK